MRKRINLKKFSKEAIELLKQHKPLTGKDGIFTPLMKEFLEAALEGEMDAHLKKEKKLTSNRRNGYGSKNLKSSGGAFEILTPRDRNGDFNPQIVQKRQTILPGDIDEKILNLYGLGMSYTDIQTHLKNMYGIDVSDGVINSITDRIIPVIREWQSRPLERIYCVVWMDAIHFKVREEGRVVTKAIYTILGANAKGEKEVLGLYTGDSESASFWLQVLTDLKNRGVKDILIACIDNLKGFADAIETVYPETEIQLCVIHQIRNSLKYMPKKYRLALIRDLKKIYQASSIEIAEHNLNLLEEKWGKQYPIIIKSWRTNWFRLSQYFKYPEPIRKIIYTTNTVEGYHRMVRKITKSKGAFTSEMAMLKLVYLATIQFQKRWKKQIHSWTEILNYLLTYFENRIFDNDTV
jgi:transposase-like protein